MTAKQFMTKAEFYNVQQDSDLSSEPVSPEEMSGIIDREIGEVN